MNAKEQRQAMAYYNCDGGGCAAVSKNDGWAGPGWYVWCSEYPDDGSAFLGKELHIRRALGKAKVK